MKSRSFWKLLNEANPTAGLLRSVTVLASGSVVAQCIIILGSPLLTRLYSPMEVGVFATFSAALVVLTASNALSYHVAIPLAVDDGEAINIGALSSILSLAIFFMIFSAVSLFLREQSWTWWFGESSKNCILLLPLAVLIAGFYEIARSWRLREKKFLALSLAEIYQRVTTLATQVILGLWGLGAIGLIIGTLGGLFASLIALIFPRIRGGKVIPNGISSSRMLFLMKRYRQFPLFRCPSGIVFWGGRCAPILIFPWFFGPVTTGLYALTDRVLQAPMAFVGAHIQSVFLSYCAELKLSGKLSDTALAFLRTLLRLGLPAFGILACIAPETFALVFGEAWRSAGTYAQLLMPYMFFSFISLPLNALPIAFEKQQGEFLFQTGLLLVRCVSVLIGGASGSIELAIGLLSLASGGGWFLYLLWAMSLVGHRPRAVLAALACECIFSIPFILPVCLAKVLTKPEASGWLFPIAVLCWLLSLAIVALKEPYASVWLGSVLARSSLKASERGAHATKTVPFGPDG